MNRDQWIVEPSKILDLPSEEYHARPEWSHSQLKYLPDNPEEFYARYVCKNRPSWARTKKPTRGMELGTAFHAMLLEGINPPVVPADILASNGAMTTAAAKAFKKAWPDYVTEAENDTLTYAVNRCRKDPEIAAYLDTDGDPEVSLFWDDETTGLKCRGRVDRVCRFVDGISILDLKFSSGNDKRWVEKQVAAMLYYRQAAFYWDAVERAYSEPVREFVFLFAKNNPPFDAYLWRINPNDVGLGRRRNNLALDDLRSRQDSGDWHATGFGTIREFDLPKWAWDEGPQSVQPFEIFEAFGEGSYV